MLLVRYAIGYAERLGDNGNIGWLSSLANATNKPYGEGNTGGPSIKVQFALFHFQILFSITLPLHLLVTRGGFGVN